MTAGHELASLREAFQALGLGSTVTLLSDHPGRRRVVRAGDVVVKAFAPPERAAREREESGLRALGGTGLAAPLVGAGPLWTATAWIEGDAPTQRATGDVALHRSLGHHLGRLHDVDPAGMRMWPLADRLRSQLDSPPASCPSSLVRAIGRMVGPWMILPATATRCFVHGDWGTSNVITAADPEGGAAVLTVVDFEDSHVGDPAETSDGRCWQDPSRPSWSRWGWATPRPAAHSAPWRPSDSLSPAQNCAWTSWDGRSPVIGLAPSTIGACRHSMHSSVVSYPSRRRSPRSGAGSSTRRLHMTTSGWSSLTGSQALKTPSRRKPQRSATFCERSLSR